MKPADNADNGAPQRVSEILPDGASEKTVTEHPLATVKLCERTVRKASHLAKLLLLPGQILLAQTPAPDADPAQARALLDSPRLGDQVWGIYYAGRLPDSGLQELLVERLRLAQPLGDATSSGLTLTPDFAYVAALFDALIGSGAVVPLDVIMPFAARWREPALILLSRQQGTEDAILAMRDEPMPDGFWQFLNVPLPDIYWIAANNLLLGMRSGRFFTKTLEETEITQTFELRDGEFQPPPSGYGGSFAHGAGPRWPEGFPPVGLYRLELNPSDEGHENSLLARGAHSVFYRRWVPPEGLHPGRWHDPGREQLRLEYLAEWNHVGLAEAEEVSTADAVVQWVDGAALTRDIEAHLEAQAAGVRLRITPIVRDERRSAHSPLPAVTALEFTLEFVATP